MQTCFQTGSKSEKEDSSTPSVQAKNRSTKKLKEQKERVGQTSESEGEDDSTNTEGCEPSSDVIAVVVILALKKKCTE